MRGSQARIAQWHNEEASVKRREVGGDGLWVLTWTTLGQLGGPILLEKN